MAKKKAITADIKEIDFTTVEQAKAYLLEKGKKDGQLSHEEVADKLANFELDSDAMDEFFEELNENEIQMINEKDSADTDEKLDLSDMSAPPVLKLTTLSVCILKRLGALIY